MGDYRNQLEPDICQYPGCTNPAGVTLYGSTYVKHYCLLHMNADKNENSHAGCSPDNNNEGFHP